MNANELFEAFETVPDRAWKQKIQADLRGGDYNELLTRLTPEGIRTKPFYSAADLNPVPTAQIPAREWKVGYALDSGGAEAASRAAAALEQGAEELLVRTGGTAGAPQPDAWKDVPGSGTFYWVREDLPASWDAGIPVHCASTSTVLADPVGMLATTGNWKRGMKEDLEWVREAAGDSGKKETGFSLMIGAEMYQGAGANRVQELAYSLSHAHEYILRLNDGAAVRALLECPVFKLSLGGDYFMDIAKLRALRKLWALLATENGFSGECRIIAQPGLRNKTLYDYNTNMLRTTLESMSAVLGGADLVCNLPYDALYNAPNDFGDRIARNQLLLLRHEAHFDKVGNPADGSYYLESLTDALGRKALDLFKTLEKGGGLLAQLKSQQIQKKIRESARKEARAIEEGARVLVGTTAFPNPEDRMADKLPEGYGQRTGKGKTLIEPLPLRRLSAEYESKRLRDEKR